MKQLFDINSLAFEVYGYPVSYVELIGTLFGLVSVYYASKANILTWPTGIINELFLFILFFQVQLYADMFLQVYFFVVTLYGWYNWKQAPKFKDVSSISLKAKFWLAGAMAIGALFCGYLFSNIHWILPRYFPEKAAYPYADSFIMVSSIVATVFLARKKIETWYLWIIVDLFCVFLFFKRGIFVLGVEYIVFLGLASYGLFNWQKQLRHD